MGEVGEHVQRAVALGAVAEPTRTESYGDIATLVDPTGATFCIYGYPEGVKSDGRTSGCFLDMVTIDVLVPRTSARFWCSVAGLDVLEDEDDGRAVILGLSSGRRLIGLQRSSERDVAARPRARVHIDLETEPEMFDTEVDRLIDLGAVRISAKRTEHFGSGQLLIDPDGVVFCQNAYTPSDRDGRLMDGFAPGRPSTS